MPRKAWATALVLVAIGSAGPVAAQPLAPVRLPPGAQEALPPAAAPERRSETASILGAPIAVRGEPVRANVEPFPPTPSDSFSMPAGYSDPPAVQRPTRAAGLGMPIATGVGAMPSAGPISSGAVEARVRQIGASTPPPPTR